MENRIHKYRAWHKKYQLMSLPFEIFPTRGNTFSIDFPDFQDKYPGGEIEWPSDDFIYMEWTGLLDRNEKEIYESDIVKVTSNYGEYLEGNFTVQWRYISWEFDRLIDAMSLGRAYMKDDIEFEIIGNKYENSDLITQ